MNLINKIKELMGLSFTVQINGDDIDLNDGSPIMTDQELCNILNKKVKNNEQENKDSEK